MPTLQSQQRHDWGKAVLVNGTRYKIDTQGIAEVEAEDAERMLGKNWKLAKPGAMEPGEPELRESLGLSEPEPAPERAPLSEPKSTSESKSTPELDAELGERDLEHLELNDLKLMADGLNVPYGRKAGKALLIERITEARAKRS
jgi:hypothetical protein